MNTAFSQPTREIYGRITIDGQVYTSENLVQAKVGLGLSNGNEFEIGTAFSSSLEIELIDKFRDFDIREFARKSGVFEIGVKDGTVKYQRVGKFYFGEPEKVHSLKIKLIGYDAMTKADIPFDIDIEYPATLKEVFTATCTSCGLVASTDNFPNSSTVIQVEPQFYEMSAREVLADVAEMAGGYCVIDRDNEKVRIVNITQGNIHVHTGNVFSMARSEEGGVSIGSVTIVQTGTTDYTLGVDNPYFIVDNVFVQGDPDIWAPAIYSQLNGLAFTSAEINFNGNPTALPWQYHTVTFLGEDYDVMPMKRNLHFTGGLNEKWFAPYYSNKLKDTRTAKEVRNIIKTGARLMVLDDQMKATVTKQQILNDPEIQEALKGEDGTDGTDGKDGEDGNDGKDGTERFTWIRYADTPVSGMSDASDDKPYIGIAHNKTSATPSSNYNDYEWTLIRGEKGEKGDAGDDLAFEEALADMATSIIATYMSSLEQTDQEVSIRFSELYEALNTTEGLITALSSEIETNIRFTSTGIELGKSNNPISLMIKPDRISFSQGGSEVAYLSDSTLVITDAKILTSLRIGNFAFFPRPNGNLSFRKVT